MATLDELDSRLQIVERNYSSMSSDVSSLSTDVHNLSTRMDTAETKITDHETRISSLEITVADHENRLKLIEESTIKYSVSRDVKYPQKAEQGFYLYMPSDLTVDIFMEYNHGVIKQQWNWLNKIFNPNGYNRVSFDFDRGTEGRIKSLVLGQNTRVLIPTGITIESYTPEKSVLKVVNESHNSIYKGVAFGIEILEDSQELVVSVLNPTSNIIKLNAGDILVQVLHLFSYHTTPEKV